MTTKITLNNIADTALATLTGPKVTTIVYPGTETATDVVGGATINLTGAGFQSGCSVLVASTASSVVTFISSTQISFIAPALSAGTYVIYVINPDGGTAISIPGVSYSGTPNWTTTAGTLGNAYETGAISATLTATGDAPITYTLASGTLPAGSTLASNGTLSGTAQATASATTYTFTISANDAQNQTTNRSFSLTINPDVVSWVSPADSTTYTVIKDSAISNVTMSATSAAGGSITYTADTLPTGLSITGANITGTPTVVANTSTTLTATSTATRIATKIINWSITVANDPFFEYNTLLIPGASTTFVDDASTNNFAVTINGDTKPNNFNPYTPGYYSNQFTAQGQYLTFGTSSTLALGAGSFTVELWLNLNAYNASTSTLIDWRTAGNAGLNAPSFSLRASGILDVYLNISSGIAVSASSAIPLNTWIHIACVRNGTALTLYFNGVSVGTGTSAVNCSIETFRVNDTQGSYYTNCSISNLRIVKGTAVYTSAFTPSTSPLTAITNTVLLTCQSNRFIDNSSNNFTVTLGGSPQIKSFDPFAPNASYSTYGSAYFDGTGDYLTAPNNAAFNFGTGDFTVECWVYVISFTGSTNVIISTYQDGSNGWTIGITSNIFYGAAAGDTAEVRSSVTPRVNIWTHLALTRSSTTLSLFINGVVAATQSNSTNMSTTSAVTIGTNVGGGALNFTGYITDVRVVKGTAVYTTTFTPPSAPLTAIANTSLLTLQNNQSVNNSVFLDNSTNNFFVTRNGNTTQGTFSPYGGNWSNYFDGTGDYLSLSTTTALQMSADFTWEAWVYPLSLPSSGNYKTLWAQRASSAGIGGSAVVFDSTGALLLFISNSAASAWVISGFITALTVSLNQWQHIALVKNGTSLILYKNGVAGTATTSSQAVGTSGNTTLMAGAADGSQTVDGYMSNFRAVKGTALYTANFTPSTTPLTPVTNTSLLTCQSNRLIDNSINNFTITKNGDVSVQRYSPFNPSSLTPTSYSWNLYSSGVFNIEYAGSGFYKTNPALVSLSTGAFSVEGWHYATSSISSKNVRILSLGRDSAGSNTSWDLYISNGSALVWQRINTTATTYSANYTFNINTWYHVVACRDSSGNLALFVNGTRILLQANETTSYDYVAGSNASIYMGATYNGSVWSYGLGYYSNVRLIKGATAYDPTQSTLTVPTTQLAVTAQTSFLLFGNNGSDLSGNFPLSIGANIIISRNDTVSTISTFNPFGYTSATTEGYSVSTIGGSGYFDGAGDYLAASCPSMSGTWTIELWWYPTVGATQQTIVACNTGSAGSLAINIWMNTSNQLVVDNGQVASGLFTGGTFTINAWNHVAVVRNGTTTTGYINGVAVGSNTFTPGSVNNINVGRYPDGNLTTFHYVRGYISNLRVVTGTAVYTSGFIPPTSLVNAVTNTQVLLNFTGAGIYDASMINNIETIGSAQISTAQTKFGGSSVYFNGSSTCTILANPMMSFGTADFTIEMWVYSASQSSGGNRTMGNGAGASWGANKWIFTTTTPGNLNKFTWHFWNYNSGGSDLLVSTSASNDSTWKYIAVTRSGTTFRLFVNGVLEASLTSSASVDGGVAAQLTLGNSGVSGDSSWTGYLDDLRITKGYARYTANFTAPTSELKPF